MIDQEDSENREGMYDVQGNRRLGTLRWSQVFLWSVMMFYIDGLVQERRNSIANTLSYVFLARMG